MVTGDRLTADARGLTLQHKDKRKTMNEDTLKIIPLGGMGEIGKNMTVVEYRGKIVVVDCGLAFPRDEMLGIDLVLPDITYLREHRDDVLAFLITHGHEDHFGALAYVLRDINVPVYGSRLTLAFAKSKLDEHGLLKLVELNEVTDDSVLDLGPFTVRFCAMSHSVPDALAIIIETPQGRVVHSGDYKFDPTPIDGRTTDVNKLAQLGQEGVLALLADSTNVETEGSTGSESQVGPGVPPHLRRIRRARAGGLVCLSHPPHPASRADRPPARPQVRRLGPLHGEERQHRPQPRLPAGARRRPDQAHRDRRLPSRRGAHPHHGQPGRTAVGTVAHGLGRPSPGRTADPATRWSSRPGRCPATRSA